MQAMFPCSCPLLSFQVIGSFGEGFIIFGDKPFNFRICPYIMLIYIFSFFCSFHFL